MTHMQTPLRPRHISTGFCRAPLPPEPAQLPASCEAAPPLATRAHHGLLAHSLTSSCLVPVSPVPAAVCFYPQASHSPCPQPFLPVTPTPTQGPTSPHHTWTLLPLELKTTPASCTLDLPPVASIAKEGPARRRQDRNDNNICMSEPDILRKKMGWLLCTVLYYCLLTFFMFQPHSIKNHPG